MNQLILNDVIQFVEDNIGSFHQNRLDKLQRLHLQEVLNRKNPYLFRAKNILTAQDLVKPLLDAYLSSQEETLFGDFLEQLAIFVCQKVFDGHKSSAEGIDLEFRKDPTVYLVSIKSGPNWGNSSQIKKMIENFRKARRILQTNHPHIPIVSVNGCCYGKDNKPSKGDYWKLCGQNFWAFISGNENLYLDIIEPLGHKAKEHNEEFNQAYAQIVNQFTYQVITNYCEDGLINWEQLVSMNSASNRMDNLP